MKACENLKGNRGEQQKRNKRELDIIIMKINDHGICSRLIEIVSKKRLMTEKEFEDVSANVGAGERRSIRECEFVK